MSVLSLYSDNVKLKQKKLNMYLLIVLVHIYTGSFSFKKAHIGIAISFVNVGSLSNGYLNKVSFFYRLLKRGIFLF